MNLLVLERAGAMVLLVFGTRALSSWRTARRERIALTTPLVDAVLLETLFTPRPKDGDDPDLLAEMRDTFLHLNRRAYAEEFWSLHTQLVALYDTLGNGQRATMRRALVRLIAADDRWLQIVGAKTAGDLDIREAIPPLQALLGISETPETGTDRTEGTVDLRFHQELEKALAALQQAV